MREIDFNFERDSLEKAIIDFFDKFFSVKVISSSNRLFSKVVLLERAGLKKNSACELDI